jgi:hypothetical protein
MSLINKITPFSAIRCMLYDLLAAKGVGYVPVSTWK